MTTLLHKDMSYIVYTGKNATDNWNIIDKAEPYDLWFHLENAPSSHVIIHSCNNIDIPSDLIYKMAIICKKHSKLKNISNVSVIYTKIENIKKATEVGSVITQKVKKILV